MFLKTKFISLLLLLALCLPLAAQAESMEMNFNNVEVLTLIKLMNKATGKTFVFNANELQGKRITVVSKRRFSEAESLRVFGEILALNGLLLVQEGETLRILPERLLKTAQGPVSQKPGEFAGVYVTRIIEIKNMNVTALMTNLAPLISRGGVMTAIEENNLLVVRDFEASVNRLDEIVTMIDESKAGESNWGPRVLTLKYASADEVSKTLTQIYGPRGKRGERLKVLPDMRTNSLVMLGLPGIFEEVLTLIAKLDAKTDREGGNIRVYPLKYAKAEKVSEVLGKLSKQLIQADKTGAPPAPPRQPGAVDEITVMADVASNSLVVFADAAHYDAIENVIQQLDVIRPQVFIEALIMEVSLDKSLDLGVEWQSSMIVPGGATGEALVSVGGVGSTGTVNSFPPTPSKNSAVVGVIGAPIKFNGKDYSSFNAFIKASQQDTGVDILSNPQLLTLNNEEAQIKVGQSVPSLKGTTVDANGNINSQIEYKDIGVSMKITPQINADGSIQLKIFQSSISQVETAVGNLIDQGAVKTLNRELTTTVLVKDGQTVALGGLISDEKQDLDMKVPCLGDVPVAGELFRSQSDTSKKTNLMVFLTPRVVKSEEELEQLSRATRLKVKGARAGRFRVNVSNEFEMPDLAPDELEVMGQTPNTQERSLMRRD